MLVNYLHSILHRPDRGWDPVPRHHAAAYAQHVLATEDALIVRTLESYMNGFAGKSVLDLGGGPGIYAVRFAQAGAVVTYHDVSRGYTEIARKLAEEANVRIHFSLGYLEEARAFPSFDLVFCRRRWCYSINERRFSRIILDLISPGGWGYIETEIATDRYPNPLRRMQSSLNQHGIKIGPRG